VSGGEVERRRPRRDDEVLVSDRARERATAALRASFERGRFDAEELERRTADVLSARTRADLRRVTGDLPRRRPSQRRRRPVPVWQWPAMPFVLLGRAVRRRRRRRR
jgi:hypothetical protein